MFYICICLIIKIYKIMDDYDREDEWGDCYGEDAGIAWSNFN